MKAFVFIALFLLASLNIFGQTLRRESSTIPEGKIGVWIYASKSDVDSQERQDYSVLLDGKEIALMHPGKCFIAAVTPGTHSFQIGESGAQKKLELEITTQQNFFLRLNKSSGDDKAKDFEIVTLEKWREEMKDLKAIDNADIKDPQSAVNTQEG